MADVSACESRPEVRRRTAAQFCRLRTEVDQLSDDPDEPGGQGDSRDAAVPNRHVRLDPDGWGAGAGLVAW